MIGPEPAAQRGYGLIRCHSGPERHSKVYERLEIDRFLATVTCTSSMPIVWADCIRGVPALAAQKIKRSILSGPKLLRVVINPSADTAYSPNKVSAINAQTRILTSHISFLPEQLC